jgi:hypothetical protein
VLTSYGLFTLNEAGKAAGCSTFDPQNNPIAEVTYEYDGATEKRTTTDLEGKVLQTQLQTYDEHGNLLENKLSDAGGLELTEVFSGEGAEPLTRAMAAKILYSTSRKLEAQKLDTIV